MMLYQHKIIMNYGVLWDDNVIKETISYLQKCITHIGLAKYNVLQSGDCIDQLITIIKDVVIPTSRLLIFSQEGTREYVNVYKHDPSVNLTVNIYTDLSITQPLFYKCNTSYEA